MASLLAAASGMRVWQGSWAGPSVAVARGSGNLAYGGGGVAFRPGGRESGRQVLIDTACALAASAGEAANTLDEALDSRHAAAIARTVADGRMD